MDELVIFTHREKFLQNTETLFFWPVNSPFSGPAIKCINLHFTSSASRWVFLRPWQMSEVFDLIGSLSSPLRSLKGNFILIE